MAPKCNFCIPLALLALSIVGLVQGASTDGLCPGGHREGQQVNLGNFIYECRSGQLQPKGCQANGGQRREGERWDDGRVIYECKRDREFLSLERIGCIGEGSRRVNLGEKVTVGDLVYECKPDRSGVPTFKSSGCVGKDGRQYETGDTFEDDKFWYYCMDRNGVITADLVGCVHDRTRLSDGDRYIENDVIYECNVNKNPNTAEVKVAGCATRDSKTGARVDRRVGCSWVEGPEPFQITYTCESKDGDKTAQKVASKCNYSLPQGTFTVEFGCYRVIEAAKVGVACIKEGNAEARFIPLTLDENGHVQSPPAGTRQC